MTTLIEMAQAEAARQPDPDEVRHAADMALIAANVSPSWLQVFGEALRPDGAK